MNTHEEFWKLVDEYEINPFKLANIVNCPIKYLLEWYDNGVTPITALKDLKKHLGIL